MIMTIRPFSADTEGGHCQVLVVLRGSFTSQIETGLTLTRFSDSQGIHSPQ